jgi:Zn-dependent protease with chaperone function
MALCAFVVVGVIWLSFLYRAMNFMTIKFLLIPLAMLAASMRSLWVTFPRPDGHRLGEEYSAALRGLLREIQTRIDAPTVHQILITDDYNAGVVQVPRMGVLGWQQNYLLLGLPLMAALSPDQFRAVLAHELGHLSGNHGRFSGWIYRVKQTWIQLLTNLQRYRRRGGFVFEIFVSWYAPFLNAYSFVLARMQEFEADRCAVEVAGVTTAAEALICVEVRGKFLEEEFWPKMLEQAAEQPDPPAKAFVQMFGALQQKRAPHAVGNWLSAALTRETETGDTHPALIYRLKAIGYEKINTARPEETVTPSVLIQELGKTAAQQYLGNRVEEIAAVLERQWREKATPVWRERFNKANESRSRIGQLEEVARGRSLSVAENWERATCVADVSGYKAALSIVREVLTSEPDHVQANYALGEILLAQEDESGIASLERAMELDQSCVLPGCGLIYHFLKKKGRAEEAERCRQRALKHESMLRNAREERTRVIGTDRFLEHGLSEKEVAELRERLALYPQIRKVYLVRKVVHNLPEYPGYVIGVIPKFRFGYRTAKAEQKLIKALASDLRCPDTTFIIALEQEYKKLRKVFREIPGAEIYSEG